MFPIQNMYKSYTCDKSNADFKIRLNLKYIFIIHNRPKKINDHLSKLLN